MFLLGEKPYSICSIVKDKIHMIHVHIFNYYQLSQ